MRRTVVEVSDHFLSLVKHTPSGRPSYRERNVDLTIGSDDVVRVYVSTVQVRAPWVILAAAWAWRGTAELGLMNNSAIDVPAGMGDPSGVVTENVKFPDQEYCVPNATSVGATLPPTSLDRQYG